MRPKPAPLAAALLATLALAAPAHASDDPATTLADKAGDATYYACINYGGTEESCAAAPGAAPEHEGHRRLRLLLDPPRPRLQYELANDVPFANAPWIGTHNSFNSMAYGYTPSRSDSNQQLTLTQQLAIDIRSVELDVHWVDGEPKVCHGTEQHAGCTSEGTIGERLDELAAFLNAPENADQVLLLYLEDAIGNTEGYDTVAAELERAFGSKLYRGAGGKCSAKLPLTLTRDQLLQAGFQVVTVASGCGGGTETNGVTPWSTMVFDWTGDVHSESRPRDYGDFPRCGSEFDRAKYQSQMIRYYEDSTFVTSAGSTGNAAADVRRRHHARDRRRDDALRRRPLRPRPAAARRRPPREPRLELGEGRAERRQALRGPAPRGRALGGDLLRRQAHRRVPQARRALARHEARGQAQEGKARLPQARRRVRRPAHGLREPGARLRHAAPRQGRLDLARLPPEARPLARHSRALALSCPSDSAVPTTRTSP